MHTYNFTHTEYVFNYANVVFKKLHSLSKRKQQTLQSDFSLGGEGGKSARSDCLALNSGSSFESWTSGYVIEQVTCFSMPQFSSSVKWEGIFSTWEVLRLVPHTCKQLKKCCWQFYCLLLLIIVQCKYHEYLKDYTSHKLSQEIK